MKRLLGCLLLAVPGLLAAQTPATSAPAAASTIAARQDRVQQLLAPDSGPSPSAGLLGVVLSTQDKDVKLEPTAGTIGTTYAFVTALIFADFPGLHASTRIADAKPTIHILIGGNPTGRVFLVKAQTNERTDNRSVKLGHSGFGSFSGLNAPDAKWSIAYTATEGQPGNWTLTPTAELAPGEYGIFTAAGTPAGGLIAAGGVLYGFGVDSAPR